MSGRKKAIVVCLLVVIIFTAVALAFTRPLVTRGSGEILGDYGDVLIHIYTITWTSHSLFSNPFNLFNATMFYPNNSTLAYTDYQLANSLVALPALGITRNPVFAYNFVLILVIILSALGGFLLVRHLTGDTLGGIAGGLIFGFPLYKLAHITHLNLLSTGFIPLALLGLHLFTERKKPVYLALFGIFTVALFWTAWSYGFFLAFAVLIYLVVLAIVKRDKILAVIRRNAGASNGRDLLRRGGYLLAAFAVIALVLVPFATPYLKVQNEHPNFVRDIRFVDQNSPDLQDFLAAPATSWLWGGALKRFRDNTYWRGGPAERDLFTGILPLILALVGIVVLFRRRRDGPDNFILYFYGALGVLALVMCLGPSLNVARHHFGIWMPYRLLYYLFPGFKANRTPGRLIVLALLSGSVFAGFAVKWTREKLTNRFNARLSAAAVVLLLLLIATETMSGTIPTTRIPSKAEFPSVYRWLSTLPGSAPMVIMPLPKYNPKPPRVGMEGTPNWVDEVSQLVLEPYRLYYNTANWKKMVNGYSAFTPPSYFEAVKQTRDFPSDRSIGFLRRLKVSYVVMEGPKYDRRVVALALARARTDPRFRLIKSSGGYYVFRL